MACEDKQKAVTSKITKLAAQLTEKSKALGDEMRERAKEIDPDVDTSGIDAWVSADIDIRFERVEFSLDLPEITIKDQKWALDLPQVTMKNQDIIFHTPSVRMKTVKTGEYPETRCEMKTKDVGFGVKIDVPECTVHWSPIYIDVPEPFDQEQRIVLSVPEFTMGRTEFVLGVPEFKMTTQKFALHLPQVTVKNIKVEAKKAEEKGRALSEEGKTRGAKLKEEFKENAKVDVGQDVTALFDCYQAELMTKKNAAMAQFETGVNVLQSTIAAMTSSKVPEDNDSLKKARASLADLIAKRNEFFATIEQRFKDLGDQQKVFFQKLVGGA